MLPDIRAEPSALAPYRLRPMAEPDVENVLALMRRSLDANKALYARRTFDFHFECARAGIDDGRRPYVLEAPEAPDGDRAVVGLAGLHCAPWGPPEHAWLSWLGVERSLRGRGIGSRMIRAMMAEARAGGRVRMLIETYSGDPYAPARRLYAACGFEEVGRVRDGYPDGDTIVYARSLADEP